MVVTARRRACKLICEHLDVAAAQRGIDFKLGEDFRHMVTNYELMREQDVSRYYTT